MQIFDTILIKRGHIAATTQPDTSNKKTPCHILQPTFSNGYRAPKTERYTFNSRFINTLKPRLNNFLRSGKRIRVTHRNKPGRERIAFAL